MQQYDIAAKVLIESCRDEIIRFFTGIEVSDSTMVEELPQETVSLKRSDFPVLVTDEKGEKRLVILEIQTQWNRGVPLHLLDYRIRYLLRHDVIVISCVILLRPSKSAAKQYTDNEVRFEYNLVKIYEMDARKIVDEGPLCLLPFVPLMKRGPDLIDDADALIYGSEMTRSSKAEMLTSMAILSGLMSKDMPAKLIARRKDIMIESSAYDLIKKEGLQEGILQGRREGAFESRAQSLKDILEVKFGIDGIKLHGRCKHLQDIDKINQLIDVVKMAKSINEVSRFIESE